MLFRLYLLRRMNGVPNPYSSVLESLEKKFNRMVKVLKQVCNSLAERGLNYCVFKTLRPVPYVPADVDVLIFQKKEMNEAVDVIKGFGGKIDSSSPFDVALYLEDEDHYWDLHNRIHVGGFSYIPKKKLRNHLVERKVEGNPPVKFLEDSYELSVTVGHSLFKEQVITLLDFYTVSSLLLKVKRDSLFSALKRTGMTFPFKYFLKKSYRARCFPVKVDPFELFTQFSYKLAFDSKARDTLPNLLKSILDKDSIDTLMKHFTRGTY